MGEFVKAKPVIIVHGGAWSVPLELTSRSLLGVERAARTGYDVLMRHGSALDAVEEAIKILENDPVFDAGRGSVLNAEGGIEMDAAIMTDDRGPRAGGVAGVTCFKNPITLARHVLQSNHILLAGAGAEKYGVEVGMETIDMEELITEDAVAEWKRFEGYKPVLQKLFGCDTVGCVAMDELGRISVGTSTGGITNKRVGRIGDSCIVGAGLFVEAGKGGVCCTGHGESIMLAGLAREVVRGLPDGGCRKELERMTKITGGRGGCISVNSFGEVDWAFNTERMSWAYVDGGIVRSGIDREE